MDAREYSRCETCGKRLAWLGPPQPRPCPDAADAAVTCREVMRALKVARTVTKHGGKEPHPETMALLAKAGVSWADIDQMLAHDDRIAQDDRLWRYDMEAKNVLADWINGNRDRALIVAKWALDEIDLTAGGTRNLIEIVASADEIARDIREHAEALSQQDWETDAA